MRRRGELPGFLGWGKGTYDEDALGMGCRKKDFLLASCAALVICANIQGRTWSTRTETSLRVSMRSR
jgi:hypothetical protein